MKNAILAAVGALLVAALTGCAGAAATIPAAPVAQAAPSGLVETDQVEGIPVTLSVQPFMPGENQFVVTTADEGIAAVETHVIMLDMGHGEILEMARPDSGRYEVTSSVIDMDGKWMLRVKLTTTAGEEKMATFYGKIKKQP